MLNHLLIICLLGPADGLSGLQELLPRIITKWRANKKKGRCISKMFRNQEFYHGMACDPQELVRGGGHMTTNELVREVLDSLTTTNE